MATMGPGIRFESALHPIMTAMVANASNVALGDHDGDAAISALMRSQIPQHFVEMQSEEVFDLRAGNQHRDSVGESNHYGSGNKFYRRPHSRDAEKD
jgi:hypothetical protein